MAAILVALALIALIWALSRGARRGDAAFAGLQTTEFEVSAVLHCDEYKIAVDRARRKLAFVNVEMQLTEGFNGVAHWGGGLSKQLTVVTDFDNVRELRLRRPPPFPVPVLDIYFVVSPRAHHVPLLTLVPYRHPREFEFLQRELGVAASG